MKDDIVEDDAGLPLGEWVSMPRRSRTSSGQDPLDAEGISMLHAESSDLKGSFYRFYEDSNNGMFGEEVDVLKVGTKQGA